MRQSLRLRLILLLGAAIVAAALVQFITSFRAATGEANKLFDYHMQQMAFALQDNNFNQFDWYTLPDSPNEGFDFVIQVWEDGGARVYQSREFRFLPERATPGYSTVILDNGAWRIFALRTHRQLIQISQRMQARHDQAISLALRSLWPIVPVSLLLLAAAWWVVTMALSPLNRIGRDLAARDVDSFEPVSGLGVPREVFPLLAALNALLSRFTQTVKSQRQFVADAAHELRTPVTALKLQVQTLARARDETARTQAIIRLEGGVDRAAKLIEQLLVLARQDPACPIETETFSLSTCAQQAIADVLPFAIEKGIHFHQRNLTDVPLTGHAENVRILLRNLLDNAVRYTPEQGCVEIDAQNGADYVMVTIEDSGIGIAAPERTRVFDRFYRVTATGASGSGLGLAIAKAIADRHDATIEFGDSRLGGAAVRLRFPCQPPPSANRKLSQF